CKSSGGPFLRIPDSGPSAKCGRSEEAGLYWRYELRSTSRSIGLDILGRGRLRGRQVESGFRSFLTGRQRLLTTRTMVGQSGTGRDEATDDDVALEAAQLGALAHDGSLGKHAGGFPDGHRRDEGDGRQRGLGDTQKDVLVYGRALARSDHLVVFVIDLGALDLLFAQEAGIARFGDDHTTHHLAHDDFIMLVVDLHALQTIHGMHFV